MKSLISKDTKVLLQLSGGKDSIACMIYLKEHSMEFEAIHFVHKYTSVRDNELYLKAL